MKISIVERPEMKAAVLKTVQDGRDVRQCWKQVHMLMKDHPARTNDNYGLVFVPEWQWPTGVNTLWVGVQVDSFDGLPEELETLTIPSREFAKVTVCGDRQLMDQTYQAIGAWFREEGYERDMTKGSFGFEANRLRPVNPFDIPADVIDHFDFDIYAPIKAG